MAGWKGVGLGVAMALVVLAMGCAGGYGSSEQLQQRIDEFNEQVRWGRYFSAATLVQPDAREEWLTEHRQWGRGDLRIADWEIVDSTMEEDGETAVVRVVVSWYRLSQSEVHSTMLAQRWRRDGRIWMLSSEEVEEGTPL